MSETKRTPGKWYTYMACIRAGDGRANIVCDLLETSSYSIKTDIANADYICRAVNCHERLVDAVKNSLDVIERQLEGCIHQWLIEKRDALKALIAEAEGGSK